MTDPTRSRSAYSTTRLVFRSSRRIHRPLATSAMPPQYSGWRKPSIGVRSRSLVRTASCLVIQCVATHWITKQEAVRTSDLERTPIDGLRQPEYCGGIAEVAKGLWMRRDDLKTSRVVEYALRLRLGSVIRRLGYLLDLYRLAPELELERLRSVDLRKMKAHGLIERDGKRYAYR